MENLHRRLRLALIVVATAVVLLTACRNGGGNPGGLIAVLTAPTVSGTAPLTVEFSAAGSNSPDSPISDYDWDWESDGTFDANTAVPAINHVYPDAGVFTATLQVTNDAGETDTDTLQIRVLSGSFTDLTLDVVADTGTHTSAAIIGGRPAIAYRDNSDGTQKYVVAASSTGLIWGTPLTVVPGEDGGLFCDLAEINDAPAIVYFNEAANRVMYVRATDDLGMSWGAPVEVGLAGEVGDLALALVEGNPAVALLDVSIAGDGDPVYIRALDGFGSAWGGGVIVDEDDEDVTALDMLVTGGAPGIGYVEATSRDLRFVQGQDSFGTSWFLPEDAVSTGAVGNHISFALVEGVPAAAYLETSGGNTDLFYVQAQDDDGVDWNAPAPVDTSTHSTGQFNSLAVVGGMPAVSFYNLSLNRLEYATAVDDDGSAWDAPVIADDSGDAGQYSSLVNVQGSPGISYYEATGRDLKWAILE